MRLVTLHRSLGRLDSRFLWVRWLRLEFVLFGLITTFAPAGEEAPSNKDTPIQMAPFFVNSVKTSIKIRPLYRESASVDRPRVSQLRVEEVDRRSPAERAGLMVGMEILAINGIAVKGLDEEELDKLWRGPFSEDRLILKVARIRPGFTSPPYEVRIPLRMFPPTVGSPVPSARSATSLQKSAPLSPIQSPSPTAETSSSPTANQTQPTLIVDSKTNS